LPTSATGGFLLARRNLAIVLATLVTAQVALPLLLAVPAAAINLCGIPGQDEPIQGAGSWSIVGTVRIPSNCQFAFDGDVQILGHSAGALFIEGGVLTLSAGGWLNITQGGVLDITRGGQLHVSPGNPNARLRVSNGASLRVDTGTVELEGLDAPGTSNQGSISLTNVTLTARSVFSATTNSLDIVRSTVSVNVSAAPAGGTGAGGVLNLGGRIVGQIAESSVTLQAGNGGAGSQGSNGGAGGSASSVVATREIIHSTLRIAAGQGGPGGTGPPGGTSGGQGGTGGSAVMTMSTESVLDSTIEVLGGPGGVGGHGGESGNSPAGNGGQGRSGGAAYLSILGYDGLDVSGSTLRAAAGAGGTGGSGGKYTGNSLTDRGGDAANGAQGGPATALIDAPGDVTVTDSTLRAQGAPGGLGGAYGLSEVAPSLSSGRAGNGGSGGVGTLCINASANSLDMVGSTVLARGGAGGTGGEGKLEGGSGGDGANALACSHAHIEIELLNSCYTSEGGPGGAARSAELASGYGGRGGKGNVTVTADQSLSVTGGCLGARSGNGGTADASRVGAKGLEADLWVDADWMQMFDTTMRNPLNDYNGTQPADLYNVTFDLENAGQSPVIPRGTAPVWSYWNLTVLVNDGLNPIQGASVQVQSCPGSGDHYEFKQTGADGTVTFTLPSHRYTSQTAVGSFVGCYDAESSYEGQADEPEHVVLESNHHVLFQYPSNNYPPTVTFVLPQAASYRIDVDHPDIPLEVIVADPDDPITGVESRFTVWACIARDPTCFDRNDITDSIERDPNTNERRYSTSFNVTNVNEWPSDAYYVCAKASDGLLESVWNCINLQIVQVIRPIPQPELSPGGSVRDKATNLISFNGRVNNLDTLHNFDTPISIMIYRWDFDGDGDWDYYSSTSGQTTHLYPNPAQTTTYRANFSVVDSLGRESPNVTREVTIDPFIVEPPSVIYLWYPVILYTIIGAVALTGTAYTVQRRRARLAEEETKRREAEILANIHECPRCGDLLPAKFAVCVRCATEDSIASVKKTVTELKHVGVIVLEEEDLIEKAAVSFEGRDFETANQFLEKVKSRVEVNKKRHKQTTDNIRRGRLHIRMLQEQGKDLAALEPELYHAELALGRSDFDGADRMVEKIRERLQAVVYEDKRREILERFTKLERKIKSAPTPGEPEAKAKLDDANKLMQRAKLALGKQSYVESVGFYTEAFTLVEGAPPDKIVTEPTDQELDLFETRMKMVEEGVYMGPAQPAGDAAEKVWRPGEKEFDVGKGEDFKPHEGAGTMDEGRAHGRSFDEAAPKPEAKAAPVAPVTHEVAPEPMPEPVAEPEAAPQAVASEPAVAATPAVAAALACSVCGTALQPTWKRCPKCATPVEGAAPPAPAPAPAAPAAEPAKAVPSNCPNCRKPVKANWKKCPYCATPLA
jgi:hypothetical protein